MKKGFLVFTIIFALGVIQSQATVWRVNNNAAINANFISFTAAQNAAAPNDTLYFEGSSVSYGNIVLTKPLTIIGPGYFTCDNPQTQANKPTANFGTISFNTGSVGSTISGLYITNTVTINVSSINIVRCYLSAICLNSNSAAISNILINGCFIYNDIYSSGAKLISNVIITNNLIEGYYESINLDQNTSGVISNCILKEDLIVWNFICSNNILTCCGVGQNNNVFFNNIGSGNQFPAGNGNQQNINMTDVFVGATGNSPDGQYQLKPGSPAIGAGNDGTDCGIFGGVTPYVLSGLPAIPAIYEIDMPSAGTSTNGINVTVKAKTH
jgi:hypothetical protein